MVSCDVGRKRGSDLILMWLWQWPTPAAVVLIGPLAWEPSYALGGAQKRKKKKKEKKLSSVFVSYFVESYELVCQIISYDI